MGMSGTEMFGNVEAGAEETVVRTDRKAKRGERERRSMDECEFFVQVGLPPKKVVNPASGEEEDRTVTLPYGLAIGIMDEKDPLGKPGTPLHNQIAAGNKLLRDLLAQAQAQAAKGEFEPGEMKRIGLVVYVQRRAAKADDTPDAENPLAADIDFFA